MICGWCSEEIREDELCQTDRFHDACAFRSVAGSVAHILRRCSCYVPGSTEGDPEGMTLREAAVAALLTHQRLERLRLIQGSLN